MSAGKGDKRRPCFISQEESDRRWAMAFPKKKRKQLKKEKKKKEPDNLVRDEDYDRLVLKDGLNEETYV